MNTMLFEIVYNKHKDGKFTMNKKMQMPSTSKENALVQMGQMFDEDTTIDVVSIEPACGVSTKRYNSPN